MTDFAGLLTTLAHHQVDFIVIDGAAAIAHGSARLTQDLDLVYDRSPQNLTRLVRALADHKPYLRGAPPGLPFGWDPETLARGLNFTLVTSLGDIDLLGEIPGSGTYQDLREGAIELQSNSLPLLEPSATHSVEARRRPSTGSGSSRELDAIQEERS